MQVNTKNGKIKKFAKKVTFSELWLVKRSNKGSEHYFWSSPKVVYNASGRSQTEAFPGESWSQRFYRDTHLNTYALSPRPPGRYPDTHSVSGIPHRRTLSSKMAKSRQNRKWSLVEAAYAIRPSWWRILIDCNRKRL